MIAHLKGIIEYIEDDFLILDVGGVGYRVFYGMIPNMQTKASLKLHIVYQHKEDSVTLYGFATRQEATMMRTIQSRVSGVGGKSAMLIMRTLTTTQIADAVLNERPEVFKTVHGIGKKTAERIVLELKDVMENMPIVPGQLPKSGNIDDARAGLRALGFTIGEIEKSLEGVNRELPSEEIIRKALERLG